MMAEPSFSAASGLPPAMRVASPYRVGWLPTGFR